MIFPRVWLVLVLTWNILRGLESEGVADWGGDVQCWGPGGRAVLVALIALLEGPDMFLLTSQCSFLPFRLHFTDEGSGIRKLSFDVINKSYINKNLFFCVLILEKFDMMSVINHI